MMSYNDCVVFRLSRNESEKLRRDRLNALMYELAQHVPLIPPSDRKMDKSSVLRLTVNYLRIHGELRYASPALPDFPKLQNNATVDTSSANLSNM